MQHYMNINLLLTLTGFVQVITASKPQVKISGPDVVVAGVSTLYECSAICSRTCNTTWNVKNQSFPGSSFTLTENGVDDYILIACTVEDKDQMHIVVEIRSITVINPISVKPVPKQRPKVGRSFHLACDGVSPPVTITWLKNGAPLTLDSRMSLSQENATLSFSLLEESDSGQYQCNVLNGSVNVISKTYKIDFGYVFMDLTGPNEAEVGRQNLYTCNAQCGTDCTVQWALDSGFPGRKFNAEGPKIIWTPSEIGQTQVFTCITLNAEGDKIKQVSKTVTVVEAWSHLEHNKAAKPGVAMVSSATLLMLVSACV